MTRHVTCHMFDGKETEYNLKLWPNCNKKSWYRNRTVSSIQGNGTQKKYLKTSKV